MVLRNLPPRTKRRSLSEATPTKGPGGAQSASNRLMMPPTIGDYYRAAIDGEQKDVDTTPDARVVGLAWENGSTTCAQSGG